MPTAECPLKKSRSLNFLLPIEEKIREQSKIKPQKIILIAGPTASGKSALSLMLAKKIGGEIISADSIQIYKGLDIGTAKVSLEDRTEIPHHLIDIRTLQESFNVVDFYYEAHQICESILARGKVPIVVGGSGFYFRSLLYGPPQGPPSLSDVRIALEEQLERVGAEELYSQLKAWDPVYAATITSGDKQKIVRALEIITLTGGKVSTLTWQRNKVLPDFSYHCWFLYRPREVLYPLIEQRCEQMLSRGLIEEVERMQKEGLEQNSSASQAIGYRQCLDFLSTSRDNDEYKKFVRKFKTASRQYAKRQFTWFRKEPLFRWLNVEVHDYEIAIDLILQDYYQSSS